MIVGRRSSSIPAILLAIAIPVLFALGIGVRMWVWPARGLAGDVDQFVLWVHGIAVNGWPNAYDQNLSFPAVMAWVWGALAWLEPAFRTVTDASDPAISALMKLPASIADLGIAVAVGWWFRDKPWAAVAAMGAVLLWPATWYVSAWWGQYESIYVLPAVLAVLAARGGRPSLVAALVALSLMTKPQALPFIVPFAAWFLATQGLAGIDQGRAGGRARCASSSGSRSSRRAARRTTWATSPSTRTASSTCSRCGRGTRGGWSRSWPPAVTSCSTPRRSWGRSRSGRSGSWSPGSWPLVVFAGVYRRPSPQGLALGLAAITLVAFVSLTTMHERYAYPAFVFLLMAANSRVLAGGVGGLRDRVRGEPGLGGAGPGAVAPGPGGGDACWARGSSRWSR